MRSYYYKVDQATTLSSSHSFPVLAFLEDGPDVETVSAVHRAGPSLPAAWLGQILGVFGKTLDNDACSSGAVSPVASSRKPLQTRLLNHLRPLGRHSNIELTLSRLNATFYQVNLMANVEAGINELIQILIRENILNRDDEDAIKHKMMY